MALIDQEIKDLSLMKSTDSLFLLKWYFDSKLIVKFEIECKHTDETNDKWRYYGKTMLLLYPIWRQRLRNGFNYEFRVIVKCDEIIIGTYYCISDLKSVEGNGEEFTITKLQNNIIREVSHKAFQFNQELIRNTEDYYNLKSFDSAFNDYNCKLWVPFQYYENPFYKKSSEHLQWTVDQKMIRRDSKEYKSLKDCKCELLTALTHPKLNESQFKVVTDMMLTVFIVDDYFDFHPTLRTNAVKTRSYLTELMSAMFGLSSKFGENTPEMDAIIGAHLDMKQNFEFVSNKDDITEFDEYLYKQYSYFVDETQTRNSKQCLNSDDFIDNSFPEVNQYLVQRFYFSGAKYFLDFNALFLSYEIPYKVKSDPNFIKVEVSGGLQIAILNDIIGLFRESKFGDYNSDIVLVLEKYGQMSRTDALQKACQIHNSIVEQYLEAKQVVIDSYRNESFYSHVIGYIEGIEHWMAGHREWYMLSNRYKKTLQTFM